MLSRLTNRWVGFCSTWLLAAALLAGCGGEEKPTPTPVPTPAPESPLDTPESPLNAPESPLPAG